MSIYHRNFNKDLMHPVNCIFIWVTAYIWVKPYTPEEHHHFKLDFKILKGGFTYFNPIIFESGPI